MSLLTAYMPSPERELGSIRLISAWDLIWALSVALLGGAIYRAWRLKGPYRANPANWPLLGHLPSLLHNLHHLYDWGTPILVHNGGSFLFHGPWFSNMRYFITTDPRNVEHALRTRFHNYPKGQDFSDIFLDLLGRGIFNADGLLWQRQRKITSIHINSRPFKRFTELTVLEIVQQKLLPTLQHFCDAKCQVDFQDLMLRFTFDTVCLAGLGVNTACLSPGLPVVPFAKAFETALECTSLRFFLPPRWWQALKWLRIGKERSMPRAIKIVNDFSEEVISSRKRQLQHEGFCDNNKADFLSCILKMNDDISHNEEFLKDMVVSFLLAGRDTSALALSWFFWLMAKHPEAEEKVVQEARRAIAVAKDEGKPFLTRAELNQMHYLHAALTEALRLYPSVPIDIKHVMMDDVLPDGNAVKRNDKFVYNIYSMGRMESIWGSDCTSFRPERWLDDQRNGAFADRCVSPFEYVAFNAGPRTCLGKDMAYLMMKAVASTVLLYFRVILVPGHKVVPKLSVSLYMKDGLLVTLEPRNASTKANDTPDEFLMKKL